jgi:cytochrome c biogenesis protein
MTQKDKFSIIDFFASVKLALFLLFILAATSIIGTLIPQNKPLEFYAEQYGANMAKLMHMLGVPDMYNAWWFLALLGLFSLNLIICSLERIPNVWRLVTQDNLLTETERLKKMRLKTEFKFFGDEKDIQKKTIHFLNQAGWQTKQCEKDGGLLVFAQKGGWTRFGVYIVHISILIIFAGAIIGSPEIAKNIFHSPEFAFKGSVMLPETRTTDVVYSYENSEKIPLGFSVRCDFFTIEFYTNGMPKEYLSKLTVLDGGKEVLKQDIEVNIPLTYKGITFYQSSYKPYNDFVITLQNPAGDVQQTVIPTGKQISWPQGNVTYGIINIDAFRESIRRVKVWFSDNQGEPSIFWIENGREAIIERPSGKYTFTAKQMYATGLQVAKDPGVWYVYTGCSLMLIGLMVAFFMSHKKIWLFVRKEDENISVLLAGSANKNKIGFEKVFANISDGMKNISTL